ncbi:hypothetical protein [Thioclava pacifica]|uniref:Uncharacterized protein n=1 Tax=Thioclava pacifica DSM 10166 TaxID=1353537 RepID=A0A074JG63_9RHOB|nr:hypothetical protein [Thioclava pacifica]KEO54558.1 hypothetical protein TP2_06400 [Thioclava pacifica DSM 10166]
MQLIADLLTTLAALAAAGYCLVLARRLKRFNQLENGMGGAIAVLSAQVDDMTRALERAQATAAHSETQLRALTERAEKGAEKLELMLASLHDLPDEEEPRRRILRRRHRHETMEAAE